MPFLGLCSEQRGNAAPLGLPPSWETHRKDTDLGRLMEKTPAVRRACWRDCPGDPRHGLQGQDPLCPPPRGDLASSSSPWERRLAFLIWALGGGSVYLDSPVLSVVTGALFLVKTEENGSAVFTKKCVPAPFPRLFINFQKYELSLIASQSAYE